MAHLHNLRPNVKARAVANLALENSHRTTCHFGAKGDAGFRLPKAQSLRRLGVKFDLLYLHMCHNRY
jgi:hypothetical protein